MSHSQMFSLEPHESSCEVPGHVHFTGWQVLWMASLKHQPEEILRSYWQLTGWSASAQAAAQQLRRRSRKTARVRSDPWYPKLPTDMHNSSSLTFIVQEHRTRSKNSAVPCLTWKHIPWQAAINNAAPHSHRHCILLAFGFKHYCLAKTQLLRVRSACIM